MKKWLKEAVVKLKREHEIFLEFELLGYRSFYGMTEQEEQAALKLMSQYPKLMVKEALRLVRTN